MSLMAKRSRCTQSWRVELADYISDQTHGGARVVYLPPPFKFYLHLHLHWNGAIDMKLK
jgi:hypothetical protein